MTLKGGALVTQAAWSRELGISPFTFRRWRAAGLIPAPLDLPGHPRWDRAVVDQVSSKIRRAGTSRYFRTARVGRLRTNQRVAPSLTRHDAEVSEAAPSPPRENAREIRAEGGR